MPAQRHLLPVADVRDPAAEVPSDPGPVDCGSVTVVIATRDRRVEMLGTLRRLRRLPERPPIVVVDNGSRDGSAEAARAAGATVVALDRDHGAAARNRGVELARTRYVALCDDDSWWAPGALARAARLLDAHPRLGLVAARIQVGREGRLDPTCAAMGASPLAGRADWPGQPVLGFLACGAVLRREAFLSVGGFREQLGVGGEERLLAADLAAAGWQVSYVEEVVAHHHPSGRRDPRRRRVSEARNALWFAWLRRPASTALAMTGAAAARALIDGGERLALAQALRGLPWILRSRRRLPPSVERDLRLIEG